jgi:hypothetical protein
LLGSIYEAAIAIEADRKGFATRGGYEESGEQKKTYFLKIKDLKK